MSSGTFALVHIEALMRDSARLTGRGMTSSNVHVQLSYLQIISGYHQVLQVQPRQRRFSGSAVVWLADLACDPTTYRSHLDHIDAGLTAQTVD